MGDKTKKEKVVVHVTPQQLIKQSTDEFQEMDDDFKDAYFRKYLSCEEFERIRTKIISFQHDKLVDIDEYNYVPTLKINNQYHFYPHMYHPKRDCFEKACYIKYKCDNCNTVFENKTLEVQKNRFKVLCKDCSFTNNTFKIRPTHNCMGQRVCYQSQFELKLIKYCNENNIHINNGPDIQYIWNGGRHKYRCDFYISSQKLLVEIKDNHVWHKNQVANGKWGAKEQAAKEFVVMNPDLYKEFVIIYPKTYMNFIKKLV
jgi:hypothetical protein